MCSVFLAEKLKLLIKNKLNNVASVTDNRFLINSKILNDSNKVLFHVSNNKLIIKITVLHEQQLSDILNTAFLN